MTKKWTDEERAAFGAKMKALRENKKLQTMVEKMNSAPVPAENRVALVQEEFLAEPAPVSIEAPAEQNNQSNVDLQELLRQNQEVLIALLRERQGQTQPTTATTIGTAGRVLGEVEKYTIDPHQYTSPVERLAKEPKLATIAFDYNYELDYEMGVHAYENKAGINMKEPKFLVRLTRIALDKDGNQTDKRYIIKNMRFHEDPQAALVIAREQGIPLDNFADEKLLLDEMRYLRVKDWLFDIFWPKGADRSRVEHTEEVVDGTIVQTFSKPVGEPGGLDFDKLR